MSIDSLGNAGRIVARLSSILQDAPQKVEVGVHMAERVSNIARVLPHNMERIATSGERIGQALNHTGRLVKVVQDLDQWGGRVLDSGINSLHRADQWGGRVLDSTRESLYKADQWGGQVLSRITKGSHSKEAAHERAAENLQELGEAGLDILQGIGWGLAGDLEQASEKFLDAAVKSGDVFIRGLEGPNG